MGGKKKKKRWILSLHLHLQGGKKHAWKWYLCSLKKLLLKMKGNISLKLAWLPIEMWLQCMSICLTSCPNYLLNQLTNSSWSWWSNRRLWVSWNLVAGLRREMQPAVWAPMLSLLAGPAARPSSSFAGSEKEMSRGEEGRRRNGDEGGMCERSGGMAGLSEVEVRCTER